MKFFFFCLMVLAAQLVLAQDDAALLQKVKAKLEKVKDYTAEGKLKLNVSFIDAPDSKVEVYYKSPDKFKIKKNGGISILPKGGISVNMSSLLAEGKFDIVPGKNTLIDGIETKVLKLLPQDETNDVVLATMYIDEKELLVRKATVTRKESGTYDVVLSYGRYADWGLPDKVIFSFNTKDYKLPRGITFEYEKGGTKKAPPVKDKKGKLEISYSNYIINKGVDGKIFE